MNGKILQVIGPVVDVYFKDQLPEINEALKVKFEDKKTLTLEVALHLGDGVARTIALEPTEGLKRNMLVQATGNPILVPVGESVLGRIFNVLGEPIDNKPISKEAPLRPIHRNAPDFVELSGEIEILETGIKVIDLLAPYIKGGKIGLFGGAGVGKTVLIQELIDVINGSKS